VIESVAASIHDFAIGLQIIEKSKLEMTERMTLRILEGEEKNRKTAMEGQLALANLFLNAIKQQHGQRATTHNNNFVNVSSGVPYMPSQPMTGSAHIHCSPIVFPEPEIIMQTPSLCNSTPITSTTILNAISGSARRLSAMPTSSTGTVVNIDQKRPPLTPHFSSILPVVLSDCVEAQATSIPPPLQECSC
jgi:hypothetical protein